jgi:hypothetical protein
MSKVTPTILAGLLLCVPAITESGDVNPGFAIARRSTPMLLS